MASASLVARCADTPQNPRIKFIYAGSDYTNRILYINPITRTADLSPSYVQIKLDNYDGTFDILMTDQSALTEKVQIIWGFGGVGASYTASTIAYGENTPAKDTIEDSADQFVTEGFKAGMVIIADDVGSAGLNDGDYTIDSVAVGALTLIATDDVANEAEGDEVLIISEDTYLFTGYVEKAEADFKEKNITLTCRDRLSLCLDKQIHTFVDDVEQPVYWNQLSLAGDIRGNEATVSEIVWSILTLFAELDDTESTANTDIDYTSFLAWVAEVDAVDWSKYDLQVYCMGESCNQALMRICELTESMIWVGGEGKIKFWCSLQEITGQTYTKGLLSEASWSVDITKMVNIIRAKCAYNSSHDLWIIQDYYDSVAYGPMTEPYVYQTEYNHDRSFCHNSGDPGSLPDFADSQSALTYSTEKFKRCGAPPRKWKIECDTLGFLEDIGNAITLSGLYAGTPYDAIEIIITSITFDIETWTCSIEGNYLWLEEELPS